MGGRRLSAGCSRHDHLVEIALAHAEIAGGMDSGHVAAELIEPARGDVVAVVEHPIVLFDRDEGHAVGGVETALRCACAIVFVADPR